MTKAGGKAGAWYKKKAEKVVKAALDSQVSSYLQEHLDDGIIDSEGFFTINSKDAERKLASFQLSSPESWVLVLVQAANRGQAKRLDVVQFPSQTTVTICAGRPWDWPALQAVLAGALGAGRRDRARAGFAAGRKSGAHCDRLRRRLRTDLSGLQLVENEAFEKRLLLLPEAVAQGLQSLWEQSQGEGVQIAETASRTGPALFLAAAVAGAIFYPPSLILSAPAAIAAAGIGANSDSGRVQRWNEQLDEELRTLPERAKSALQEVVG